jgi:hypothetical protein
VIFRNWVIAAITQKSDALRSPRTAATKAPRLVAPGQLSSAQTYNPSSRSQSSNPRWHSSPLESESRNPHRGWTRFRGPVRPNGHALVGYVGPARIGKRTTNDWLYDFIGRHPGREPSEYLSRALVADLENDLDKSVREQVPMVVHLGTFELRDSLPVPQCWYIRNLDGAGRPQAHFESREELFQKQYFGKVAIPDVRHVVEGLANQLKPFWFHQGADLATFNTLDDFLRGMFRLLIDQHPEGVHKRPESLEDWARFVRMSILTFEAYYESFRSPADRVVGGGADVEWIRWGAEPPIASRAKWAQKE